MFCVVSVCVAFLQDLLTIQNGVLVYTFPLHTYIIAHYNTSVRIINLVSQTTYIVCVNFIRKWRYLQFKIDSERQIFEKLFMVILFILRVFTKMLLRGNGIAEEILCVFCFDDWPGA